MFRRNQIIADLFARIHFGEKMGTGFERIREICKKDKAPFPKIEFDEHYFYVTFKQSNEYLKLVSKVSEKWSEKGLTKRQIEILTIINKNPKISRNELSKLVEINPSAIQKQMEQLKKKGFLKRIGPDNPSLTVSVF